MKAIAAVLVWLGLRLIPRQHRHRYAAEFAADMSLLGNHDAFSYASSTLRGAPGLRVALVSRVDAEGRRHRSLRCFIGRHDYAEVRLNPEDTSIVSAQCVRCLRISDGPVNFPHDHTKGDVGWLGLGQGGWG